MTKESFVTPPPPTYNTMLWPTVHLF